MELTISLPHGAQRLAMTGTGERNLKIIRDALDVSIAARNGSLRISGDGQAVARASQIIEQLSSASRQNRPLSAQQLLEAIAALSPRESQEQSTDQPLEVYTRGRSVSALTEGQQAYLQSIFTHDLTFCTGPAGTGKTYLAVAAAVSMLKRGQVRKLVLVRPAVEAGERLGFLPGDLRDKVNPYLRPLLDALHDMMDFEQIQRFMACDLIEIIPLAFMRGRTLNDAMIILDEAQNSTRGQMLMFLTRLGRGSRMIVTGDTSQIDLPDPTQSGLIDAIRRLQRVKAVAFVSLQRSDIVRHNLVQRIVQAYGPQEHPPLENIPHTDPTEMMQMNSGNQPQ